MPVAHKVENVKALLAAGCISLVLVAGCDGIGDVKGPGGSESLPEFSRIRDVEERKRSFFSFLRPIIVSENTRVAKDREKLLELYEKDRSGQVISWAEMKWLEGLLVKYEIQGLDIGELSHWDNLLRRVDIIPVDLALVQAAKESGWGTSRFARQGNNLFGEWCFEPGCGIVPEAREPGATHEVAKFASVRNSVRSYMHNLNTFSAYRRFRRLRFKQRLAGKEPDGFALIDGLPQYSERKEAYLEEIRVMFRVNRRHLDS